VMLQELCCCLLLFSGVAPSSALRPTTENILDLNAYGQFSLEKTLQEEPGLPENLRTNMRGIIEENLLKGLTDPSVQPSAHDPELQRQVASMLQQAQASSLEDKFSEQFELEKVPAKNTQVLLEMGSSMKKILDRPHIAETISGQFSKVQQFIGEHPGIGGEIERYVEHARPSQHSGAQAVPPSLMEEIPDLAKKLLPMFKTTVLGTGQSNLSLLQSSTNMSDDVQLDPYEGQYTRFETAFALKFPLPCSSSVCWAITCNVVMVKLHPVKGDWTAGAGFVILVPGVSITMESVSFALSPFIPIPMEWTGFLGAQKSGFAASIGWKATNMTKLQASADGKPTMTFSAGCSYLPISVESKKNFDDMWGARTEPMIEVAGSWDFAAQKWGLATAFKLRSAVSYGKDQYFFIFKFGLGGFKGDTVKAAAWPGGITFGLLYHVSR